MNYEIFMITSQFTYCDFVYLSVCEPTYAWLYVKHTTQAVC